MSTHPIATAFINYVEKNNMNIEKVNNFKNIPGVGLTGNLNNNEYSIGNEKVLTKDNLYKEEVDKLTNEGNSIVYVVENDNLLALIGVKDTVRDNTKEVIEKLNNMSKKIIMLTGDNKQTASIIAKNLNIKEVIANVTPKEKSETLRKLKENGEKIMMVGDGINDAPSLSLADIGVSLNSGTDIAGDSSDVILMNNNLKGIYNLFTISKKTIQNIKQNLFWAFFYNVCMIPIAVGVLEPLGIKMNPMIAGLAMTLSSITVILNTLRLKRWREE